MAKNALRKDFFMEIRKSMGRFVSIFFIVALGVAFYSGIRASEPSMRISGDTYFDRERLMDIKVMGTLGLTEEDVQAIEAVDGIELAEGAFSKDVLCPVGDTEKVVHLLSAQKEFNRIDVVDGRMPEKAGECLVDEDFLNLYGFEVGDQFTVRSGEDAPLSDSLTVDTFTIVGAGNSPLYISFGRGNSFIGNGEVSGFMIVDAASFCMEVYSEIYVRVEGAAETIAYTEAYNELSDAAMDALAAIEEERCQARRQEIVDQAMGEVLEAEETVQEESRKLTDAKSELEEGRKTAENELAKAWKKLKDAEQQLADAKKQIVEGEAQLASGKQEWKNQQKALDAAKQQYEDGLRELTEKEAELLAGEEEYKKAYEEYMPQIEAAEKEILEKVNEILIRIGKEPLTSIEPIVNALERITELVSARLEEIEQRLSENPDEAERAALELEKKIIERLKDPYQELSGQIIELYQQKQALIQTGAAIEEGKQQIAAGKEELARAREQIEDGQRQLDKAYEFLLAKERELTSGKTALARGEKELISGKLQYESGASEVAAELAEGQFKIADGEAQLSDARREIAEAKAEIEKIEHPKWYIQNRSEAMQEYDGYGENADRMRSLGKVFPVLFFLVAALISLTSMTRMVEEQRTLIGTLKAIGYGKFAIAKKYIYYALIATLGGSIFGVLVGEKILPFVIIFAYKIMYKHIPDILLPYHMSYAVQATVIAVFCTLAATMVSCYKELASQPAQLMRPPTPKSGKRILLERAGWFWNRLSFTWKSSVRNMIRYKKRFFMTVFGIGGCMALMVVGFGLKDCIYEIVTLQYEEIQFYDGSIYMEDGITEENRSEILEYLGTHAAAKSVQQIRMQSVSVKSESGSETAFVTIPEDEKGIEELFCFRNRINGDTYHLEKEQVILTEKVASLLEVEVGDKVTVMDEKLGDREFTVQAICENYMGNYLYLSNAAFEEAFDAPAEYNSILYSVKDGQEEEIEKIGAEILKRDNVLNVTYTHSIEGRLDDMLGSLNLVIIVLIISAGMLAFVVLYNLNNINITERRRELATLKVLGFYDTEVATYVFRENIMLTFISSVVGVTLGKFLHRFVILTVEVEEVMFGRDIKPESYLYSFLFTLAFSLFINWVMYFKLKKINMVESLKSVE